jgi:hypothetical protein
MELQQGNRTPPSTIIRLGVDLCYIECTIWDVAWMFISTRNRPRIKSDILNVIIAPGGIEPRLQQLQW